MREEAELWERQDGEREKAYDAFCVYRDMKYESEKHKRNLRGAAIRAGYKSEKQLDKWSSEYRWQERCDAYDKHVEQQKRAKNEAEIIKMTNGHAKAAGQLVAKALKRLLTLPEDDLSAADVVRMFDTGVKIERLSRGVSTENTAITGSAKIEHAGRIEVGRSIDVSKLSDEELSELERLLEKLC